jgi:glycosyltransferase involved in cell wall biosynthesis
MKIGMVLPWFPSHISKEKILAIFYYRQSKKLTEMGHEIFVMTVQRPNMPKFEIMDEISVYRFPARSVAKIGYDVPHFKDLTQTIRKVCTTHKLDMIEFSTQDFLTSIPVLNIKKWTDVPIIVTVNGLPGISWFSSNGAIDSLGYVYTHLIGRRIIKSADGIRSLSSSLYSDLVKFGMNGERIRTIHRGVDTEIFYPNTEESNIRAELGIRPEDFLILFVGRLIRMKGLEYLLSALKDLIHEHKNLKLIILGDGEARSKYENSAKSMKDYVKFVGRRSDVYRFMCTADVVVLPSLCEGCPNVVLEAMACGTPVIATRVGAVPDIIENGKSGIIVEQKNITELKTALLKLIKDQNFAKTIGFNGRKRIEKEFTWDAICKKLERFYNDIVEIENDNLAINPLFEELIQNIH